MDWFSCLNIYLVLVKTRDSWQHVATLVTFVQCAIYNPLHNWGERIQRWERSPWIDTSVLRAWSASMLLDIHHPNTKEMNHADLIYYSMYYFDIHHPHTKDIWYTTWYTPSTHEGDEPCWSDILLWYTPSTHQGDEPRWSEHCQRWCRGLNKSLL